MKDKNGITVKTGDLMAEVDGGGYEEGKSYSSIKLWEVSRIRDGRGIDYTSEGEKNNFWWASASSSQKLYPEKLPKGFLFAFRHGLDSLDIDDDLMSLDIHEAIAKSDWKENAITPEIVEKMDVIRSIKITSFVDIAEKWESIFGCSRIPYQIMEQIMQLAKYKGSSPHNGEIGIAAMSDLLAFVSVRETLKQWKDAGCLLEKCKELDDKSGYYQMIQPY